VNYFSVSSLHLALRGQIISFFFFFYSRGVSGPAYAHHDYSPRLTGHPASPGARPSSAGYTRELEPGHSGRAKPAKATELQAPCVQIISFVA
jgi:hypothetical protein